MYSFILSLIGCSRGTLRPLCSGFVSFVITNGFVKGASRCISKNNHEIWQTTIVRYDIGESINRYRSKKKKKIRVIFQWLLKPHKWHTYNILRLYFTCINRFYAYFIKEGELCTTAPKLVYTN
uniref:Uncharacterized protein n=1 Tax=Sipha flava TaxID=143950 RepID=A0A2S2QHD3_9HEMI